ncbi:pentatricopeptide repeat-containing protein [Tanacetum coccineum]
MAPSGLNALLFDVNYDGVFMFGPLRYENSIVYELRVTNDKKYDYEGLCEFLKEKLEQRFYVMFFKLSECELDVGLKIVECDSDLEAKYEFVDAYGIIQLKNDAGNMSYKELVSWAEEEAQHLKTPPKPRTSNAPDATLDVDESSVPFEFDYGDTGASFESVDDQTGAPSEADHTGPSEAADEMGRDKIIEEDNIVNKVVDKGKGKMIEEEMPVPARKAMGRNKGIVIEENDNPNVMDSDSSNSEVEMDQIPDYLMLYSDSESEYSDRSVDYLSEGGDELIQLRKGNSEAKRAPKIRDCDDDAELTDPFKLVETRMKKYPTHDQDTHWKMKKPKVGEKFVDVAQFKECLTYYGLANGYSIWCYRSSTTQIIARCGQRPERIKDPKKGKLSRWKRSYAKAILESNDGLIVRVGVTKGYCFGWMFPSKPNVGEILTAIGRDRNNHIFPVAWAVVNVENKDNWSWFLELLGEDLELPTGNGLTLMSDQHKGLIEAVKDVMPHAEHRQCARHIYEGFRKHYSGVEFRNLLWAASKATYPGLFNKIMDKIKRANPNAYQYLLNKDPKTWSRAYFHIGTNCEAVENGFSECFNAVLVRVRNKPLITMLEAMRVIVMERMNTMRRMLDKWTDDICPNIQKRLELIKDQQRFWHVIPAGGNLFEDVAAIRKRMFHDAYHQYLTPVGGMNFWPDCSEMSKGHNNSSCKNQTVLLPPKPTAKKGRPRKIPIPSEYVDDQTEPLVPPSVPIPPVEEHIGSSQFELGGSSSTVNASKTKKMVTFKENVANRGLSISGRGRGRGPRLGSLGAWFGIHRNESDSIENTQEETMHDSEIQESQTVQTVPTQSSQTAASDGIAVDNQVVPVNEPVPRELVPRARRNFVILRQRGRSERILKRKLAKDYSGTGSSKTNPYSLD